MCQNGENLSFCCGFCKIGATGAGLLFCNGTDLRVGANEFESKGGCGVDGGGNVGKVDVSSSEI